MAPRNCGWYRTTDGGATPWDTSISSPPVVCVPARLGVSGFITMQGEDLQRLEWDKRGVLTADIRINNKQTFYTKYGDYIARLSLLIAGLGLLYFVADQAKRRFYLN